MEGICSGFKAKDLLKQHNRGFMERVSKIWDQDVAPESEYMVRESVILVDVGYWLSQRAYTDETGYFLRFRLHPLDCGRVSVKERGRRVLASFQKLFSNVKGVQIENENALYEGTEETVTVVVQTGSFSIGD